MKKQLVAAAVLMALATPALAADVSVYGRAHVTVDYLDNGDEAALNVSSNSARLGFRASTEIAEGLKGSVQIEQEVQWANGAGNFASRDTFVGLEGGFGLIRLGFFDTPLKNVRSKTDFFGDQIGDARNLTRLRDEYTGGDFDFDTRFRNGIHYRTPKFSNMTVDLHYSTNTNAGSTSDNDNDAISTAFTYETREMYAAVAYERKGASKSDAVRLGFGYSITDSVRLNALVQQATIKDATGFTSDQDVTTYGVGASFKLSSDTTIKGQVYMLDADGDDRNATMLALGLDHALSRNFRLLVAAAITQNDDNANYAMSKGGHGGQVTPVTGEDASGFSVGFRYDF